MSDGTVVATLPHDGDVAPWRSPATGGSSRTASDDDTARVWDAQTGRQLALVRHAADVDAVDLSPDGKLVASAGVDSAVRLTTTDGKPVTVLRGYSRPVKAVSFSDDGRLLVTASTDNTARVWSVASHRLVAELRHPAPVVDADFGPGGRFVVTAGDDGNAHLGGRDGPAARDALGHPSTLMDVDFAPNGRAVVAAGFGAARVYTATSAARSTTCSRSRTGACAGSSRPPNARSTCTSGTVVSRRAAILLARCWRSRCPPRRPRRRTRARPTSGS